MPPSSCRASTWCGVYATLCRHRGLWFRSMVFWVANYLQRRCRHPVSPSDAAIAFVALCRHPVPPSLCHAFTWYGTVFCSVIYLQIKDAAIPCRHPVPSSYAALCRHAVPPSLAAVEVYVWFQPIVLFDSYLPANRKCRHPVPPSGAATLSGPMPQSCAAILCRHPMPPSRSLYGSSPWSLSGGNLACEQEMPPSRGAIRYRHPVRPYVTILCRHPMPPSRVTI